MENGTLQNARSGLNCVFLKVVFNHEGTLAAEAGPGIDRDYSEPVIEPGELLLKVRMGILRKRFEFLSRAESAGVLSANSGPLRNQDALRS